MLNKKEKELIICIKEAIEETIIKAEQEINEDLSDNSYKLNEENICYLVIGSLIGAKACSTKYGFDLGEEACVKIANLMKEIN